MNFNTMKKMAVSMALAAAFLMTAGAAGSSSTFAQDWRWRDRDGWQDNRVERRQEQDGYNDGLNRGREDARDHRRFDPNNSEHFRDGNGEYREGFRRGYADGFRQFKSQRRW